VREPHLDLFALTLRLLKSLGANERPGNISGMLTDIAWDLAGRLLGQHWGLSGHTAGAAPLEIET
jgi:hypothetical protein